MRYVIGVIVGAEDDISSSSDRPILWTTGLPADSAFLYCHTNDKVKRRMFPTDLNIGRTNVTGSVATTQRDRFCEAVAERDWCASS